MSNTDTDKNQFLDGEIDALREKIKEIEDKLKQLRNRGTPPSPIPTSMGDDNSQLIINLTDRVNKLEKDAEATSEKLDNHNERIEKLEEDSQIHKDKISSNKQDIGEIKDQLPDKVDGDVFDQEINYIKELINQLMQDKDIDIKLPPPTTSSGMSTKDQNKIKEMMAKIPEIERKLEDILERLKKAENNIDNHDKNLKEHDKEIEKIWDELSKKANQSDLKDLFNRLNNLEKELSSIIDHLNNMGKGAPVSSGLPNNNDKRLDALEKKLEQVRNDTNTALRDLGKQMDSMNSRINNAEKEIDKLKDDLLNLLKRFNDLELKVDALMKLGGNEGPTNIGIDPEKLDELKKALNDLRNDYRNFKNDVYDRFNKVAEELDNKADKEDLENLKRMLLNRMNDLERALNKTKSDLKKALKALNDKVSSDDFKFYID